MTIVFSTHRFDKKSFPDKGFLHMFPSPEHVGCNE